MLPLTPVDPLQVRRSGGYRRGEQAVQGQLEAECHAGAAQDTAEGVARCKAEGAECKVRLEAEFKVRPEAEYKGQFKQCAVCFCLQVASCGLLPSLLRMHRPAESPTGPPTDSPTDAPTESPTESPADAPNYSN